MDFRLSVERDGQRHDLISSGKGDKGAAPQGNRGFREMQKAILHGPPEIDWRLLIDDVPLALVNKGRPGVWVWKPEFYAGEVEATLQDATGTCRGRWRMDVSPDINKLGRDSFFEMLKEIWDYDPTMALGTEPARRQFGAVGEYQNPIIEFLRLRYRATEVDQSLRVLLQEPIRSLRTRRRLSPPHLVRRADRHTAQSALRQPALLSAIGAIQLGDLSAFTKQPEQPVADVPNVTYHYDNATNRCLLYTLRTLIRRCKNLRDQLETKATQADPSIAKRWPEWKKFLDAFHQRLKTEERCLPFPEVTKAEVTAAGLNSVSAHPLCARFWRASWEALRHGVTGPEPADWLPLNSTWGLYERWCFIELRRWLKELIPSHVDWCDSIPSGTVRTLNGQSRNGTTVRLHLQRNFDSSANRPREFWSISGDRRPDIVLDWRRGADRGFLIFDAKYRVARTYVLDAMRSAHIYNDSLRMNKTRPAASVLLTPACTQVPWLETPEFFDEHQSCVLPLHPDQGLPCWFNNRVRELLL